MHPETQLSLLKWRFRILVAPFVAAPHEAMCELFSSASERNFNSGDMALYK